MAFESHKLYLIERRFDAISEMMKVKDMVTHLHCHRTGAVTCAIAEIMGYNSDLPSQLFYFANYLHDCGKLAILNEILHSTEVLGQDHVFREIIRNHPKAGYELLIDLPEIVGMIARFHQERYNGTGYLEGLSGKDIPLPACICAVADIFDATVSERNYKPGKTLVEALAEMNIEREKGYIHPDVAIALSKLIYDPKAEAFFMSFYKKSLKKPSR